MTQDPIVCMQTHSELDDILILHTTPTVFKHSQKVQLHSIKPVYSDTEGTFEFLVAMDEEHLPHTTIISADDIECSCVGFMHALQSKYLCTHLLLCLKYLFDKELLLSSDIGTYLSRWTERNDSESRQ